MKTAKHEDDGDNYDFGQGLNVLRRIDSFDKRFSMKIHKMELPYLEMVLLVFGLLFNRAYCLISIFTSFALAY